MEELGRKESTVLENLRYEFNEKDVLWQRDDIDAYRAAESLLDKYTNIDKYFNLWSQRYISNEIVQEYKNLKDELKKEKEWTLKNTRHYPWTSADDHIRRLAHRINEAENKAILRRKVVIERQKIQNNIDLSQKQTGKIYVERVQWERMQFRKDANNVNIVTAMGEFFNRNPNVQYRIDYKYCKNPQIRSQINSLCGWDVAVIQFDPKTKSCPIYSWGKIVKTMAPIYDWVIIQSITQRVNLQNEAQVQELSQNTDYESKLKDWRFSYEMLEKLPINLKKKLEDKKMLNTFLAKCESRIDEIIKKRKWEWAELNREEPVTRLWKKSWLMGAHFKHPDSNRVIFAWKETQNDKSAQRLPSDLYDLLDSNESDLKQYLTERLKAKRWELDYYAMRDRNVNSLNINKPINNAEKQSQDWQLYAIDRFIIMLDNLSKKWYNSNLKILYEHCKNMQFSLQDVSNKRWWVDRKNRSMQTEILKKLFIEYKGTDWTWASIDDNTARLYIDKIFNKTAAKQTIQIYIKELWHWTTVLKNADTGHITNDVESDLLSNSEDIELKRENCETTLKKINEYYWADWEWNISDATKHNIDELYDSLSYEWSPDDCARSLYLFFQRKKIIQPNVFGYRDSASYWVWHQQDQWFPRWNVLHPTVKNNFKNLFFSLARKREMVDKVHVTSNDMKECLRKQNEKLERWEMTREEKQTYQVNEAIINDSEVLNKVAQEHEEITKHMIKYYWINSTIHSCISRQIIERWWWFIGNKNLQNLYNESRWLWWWVFDISDEMWQTIWDHSFEIIAELAVAWLISVISWGTWATYIAKLLENLWEWAVKLENYIKLMATKLKWAINGTKAYKIINTIIDVKWTARVALSEVVKSWFNANPIENRDYFLESWIFWRVINIIWKWWEFLDKTTFINKHFNNSAVRKILKNGKVGELFWGLYDNFGVEWDMPWGVLLGSVAVLNRLSKHKEFKMFLKSQISKSTKMMLNANADNNWGFSNIEMKFWKDIIKIDALWTVISSKFPKEFPVWKKIII